jgi:hypothetical protein
VRIGALLAVALVLLLAVVTGILAVMIRPGACTGLTENTSPSAQAEERHPDRLSVPVPNGGSRV